MREIVTVLYFNYYSALPQALSLKFNGHKFMVLSSVYELQRSILNFVLYFFKKNFASSNFWSDDTKPRPIVPFEQSEHRSNLVFNRWSHLDYSITGHVLSVKTSGVGGPNILLTFEKLNPELSAFQAIIGMPVWEALEMCIIFSYWNSEICVVIFTAANTNDFSRIIADWGLKLAYAKNIVMLP